MLWRNAISTALVGACLIRQILSINTDLCVSVIAIAGYPDLRYLQVNNKTYDHGEDFVCELRSGTFAPITGTDEQIQQMQSLLADGKLISAETTVGVAYDVFTEVEDESIRLPRGDVILVSPSDEQRKKQRKRQMLKSGGASDTDI